VLVYDITDSESFEECKNYYKKQISNICKKDIKVILVGNKADLKKNRKVLSEEGAKFAKENNYYFKETSCENNFNVADAFETIIIMTNNDMIKVGKLNLKEKIKLGDFKIEEGAGNDEESDNRIGTLSIKKKKSKCC
jgi:GTPase SAR1 family protein